MVHEIPKLQDAKSLDDAAWIATMNEKEKETGDKLLAANHAFFKKIRDRGLKHPDERPFLMKIADGFDTVVTAVINFVEKAADWLAKKVEWVWNKIKEAAGLGLGQDHVRGEGRGALLWALTSGHRKGRPPASAGGLLLFQSGPHGAACVS
ncbi:hypothetical protein [Saccharopolyspora sp. ASAGF58]|uniref:hypothetical protein n=1 Tax=Saccharopolyspora sp. ASAGF58 TaxID=2719023 RepID=UPI00143FE67A|nr:hypothetical protein [Saccharopolyspora sp. ASAGF58]QIZ36517.1 hypothetical protein FDZ84_19905 [Saccharopolyspora sp. ASAGF58]